MEMSDFNIPPETTTEFILRIGLYVGAVFQLMCIAAILIFPQRTADPSLYGKAGDMSDDSDNSLSTQITQRHSHHRARRVDKKKRR